MLSEVTTKNDHLFLKAAKGEKVDRVPVWLMRQAGRILPEYRKVRASVSGFKELVTNPELSAEVTLQPVDILGVDAAIIFSDILVIPEAMGLEYQMIEKKGPFFPKTIHTKADIEALQIANGEDDIRYTIDAMKIVKRELNNKLPLIGFAGAPWTIFSYMIEGGGSKTFSNARKFLYEKPELAHLLLDKITKSTINYLKAQIHLGGANLVQVFDSWAGILPQNQYEEFGLKYIKQICDELSTLNVPITVFSKGATFAWDSFSQLNCQVLGVDWNIDPEWARSKAGSKTLQGNLDPCLLYASEQRIEKETIRMIEKFGPQKYIANLGHGVYPDTDFNKVKFFIDAVKNYKVK